MMRAIRTAVLIALLLPLFSSKPAWAAPFPATPDAYLSQTLTTVGLCSPATASCTRLFLIDQTVVPFAFSPIGLPANPFYNSMGFNPVDQFLYAFSNTSNEVLRIHSDGTITNLGVPTGWATGFGDFDSACGTFMADGTFLMGGLIGGRVVRIDVSTTPPSVIGFTPSLGAAFSDWAIHPLTGELYGVSSGTLRRIDPNTGALVSIGSGGCPGCGSPGGAWFDAAGTLFVQVNATGDVWRGDTATGVFTKVANGPTSSGQDAASNPFAPALEKTVTPTTIQVNQNATYTYKILNPGPAVASANFTDILPAGLEYVDGSLINPFGGTVNSYGGSNTLTISGMNVPLSSSSSITVQVLATAEGLKQNQAELSYTTAGVPTTVLSDEPGNALKPDPTDLFVEPLPVPAQADLSIVKEVTSALPVDLGATVAYRITVTNQGPDPATGVKVSDLQSGPFNSIINLGGDVSAADCGAPPSSQMGLVCAAPDIPSGSSIVLTYETSVTGEGSWSNIASVSSAEVDPVGNNNLVSAFIQTSAPQETGDTSVVVTPDSDNVDPGEPIQYTGEIVNDGPDPANNVIISNITDGGGAVIDPPELPADVGTCTSTENSFSCLIPTIPPGGSVPFNYTVTPTEPGTVESLTTVGQGANDPNLGNNSVLVEVTVEGPAPPPPTPGPTGLLEGSGTCALRSSPGSLHEIVFWILAFPILLGARLGRLRRDL